MTYEIKMGALVSDVVTGFKGIVTAKLDYINGCRQYRITPPATESGTLPEAQWFDYNTLIVIGVGVTEKLADSINTAGGPTPGEKLPGNYRG